MTANRFGPGLPFVDNAGRLTPAASNALNALIDRTGGVVGLLTISAEQVVSGVFAESLISSVSVTQHESDITLTAVQIVGGTFADELIAASNVTQHQSALSIGAGQVSSGTIADAQISESSVTQHALPYPEINAQTGTSYTVSAGDAYDVITMNNAMPNTVTIAPGLSGHVDIIQTGVGMTTVQGASGVTVNGSDGGADVIGAQWSRVRAQSVDADVWIVA